MTPCNTMPATDFTWAAYSSEVGPSIPWVTAAGPWSPLKNHYLALAKSNRYLSGFRFGAGGGKRVPAGSVGHSYQNIQKKRRA